MGITNQEFATRVGCHHSMVSRMRNGQRVCGSDMVEKIATEFGLDPAKLLRARNKGAEPFGKMLRKEIFDRREPKAREPVPA